MEALNVLRSDAFCQSLQGFFPLKSSPRRCRIAEYELITNFAILTAFLDANSCCRDEHSHFCLHTNER